MISYQDLINDMARGCKPREQYRIGLEWEQFAYNLKTGGPLHYDGTPGIRQLLDVMCAKFGWQPVLEGPNTVALQRGADSVTLEPGGQIEYAGAPHGKLADVIGGRRIYQNELQEAAGDCGAGLMAIGMHPEWTREDMRFMPKARYKIMSAYMPKKGDHGLDMMLRTCGTQINLDFESEADMIRKFRVGMALQPLMTALMANSRIVEGKDSGYESFRSFVWTDTDPDRCGILPFIFEDGMGFERYVNHALDVPMYFYIREGKFVDVSGASFRDFMARKLKGHEHIEPTMEDWHLHLSTLFPEVRLKHYLELRSPDSHEPAMVDAMTVFWAGLFYHQNALDDVYERISGWSVEDHQRLRDVVPKEGLAAQMPDSRPLSEFGRDVLDVIGAQISGDHQAYLKPFEVRVAKAAS